MFIRIQKVALRIILAEYYLNYTNALSITKLETLKARRALLRKRFALNCTKNERTKDMFPLSTHSVNTRNPEKYQITKAKTNRLAVSAIPVMQRQLNNLNTM